MEMSYDDMLSNTSLNSGFPSALVIGNVEMPADGLNGTCIIHYVNDGGNYDMAVSLVNGKREGRAILLLDGIPTRKCVYESGKLIIEVQRLDEWENMLLLSSKFDPIIISNSEEGILLYDIETESIHGIFQSDKQIFVFDWSRYSNRVVMADLNDRELAVYVNGERNDNQYTKGVIDLDANGRRWEGGLNDGEPFGYGVLFDEEGRMEYEGFILDGMILCYGIEFCKDIEGVKYEGCYCNNKRFGRGILYNRKRDLVYSGLWKNNVPYSPQFDGSTVDNYSTSISIPNNSFSKSQSFILPSFLHSLKRIVIADACFGGVRIFELNGLDVLESVIIGEKSFTFDYSERSDGSCRFMNCPKLKSIQIGDLSFFDYHSFKLNNLPSLQSIDFGGGCFYWSPFFSLTDLPQLQLVKLGISAFWSSQSVVFENLPNVHSILLGSQAFSGDENDDRATISEPPYNYKNTLTMRNLPSLTSFIGASFNFMVTGSVILEGIDLLID